MAEAGEYAVGIDIGGTFTDIVLLGDDGRVRTHKVASTPDDYGRGIVKGLGDLLEQTGIAPASIGEVVHATTVATNAILEGKSARTALVTTEGFRDVLEMRRLRIPVLYDLQYDKPPPLVPRRRRLEVRERMGPDGRARIPLDPESLAQATRALAAMEVEAVAICLLHAYANPAHEQEVARAVRAALGEEVYVSCSSDILAEIREYERTSTTVVNAAVGPVVGRYLERLGAALARMGVEAPLRIMQSNGGVMGARAAVEKPAYIVESGPAAGVIACARLARAAGLANAISFDMGGTTAKAAIVENGEPATTSEYEVGAGINLSSKLVKGGGYAIKLPFVDVSEIGAGGGSIVRIDQAGALRVGPESAGAVPGPVCYAMGGTEPTFTDAAVALGYINPDYLVGGGLRLDAKRGRRVLEERIARPLGLGLEEAAHGVFTIAAATMTRAVKAVSTYRGRDPRDFALVAFGGNGPVVAVEIARALSMRRVLIPPAPGVFSALGLLFTDVEHAFLRTFFGLARQMTPDALGRAYAGLEQQALAAFAAEGVAAGSVELVRMADLRYRGQAYELTVPVAPGRPDPSALIEAFHAEHERTYGHRSVDDPVDLINVKLVGRARRPGRQDAAGLAALAAQAGPLPGHGARPAWFGRGIGRVTTPVLPRAALAGGIEGPAIVEELDATCVLPPGCRARLDAQGNIDIDVGLAP